MILRPPRIAAFAALLALPVAAPAPAELDLTTGKEATPVVQAPAVQGARDYEILWDLSHGVYLEYQPYGRYAELTAYLAGLGFAMNVTEDGIEHLDLLDFDVLVINVASSYLTPYSQAEVQAIRDYVQGGGAVLVMTDRPAMPNAHVAPVTQAFGVFALSDAPLLDLMMRFIEHPVFDGVGAVLTRGPGQLDADAPAVPAAWTEFEECLAALVPGCQFLVVADVNIWDNDFLNDYDNREFAKSAFQVLAGCFPPTAAEGASFSRLKGLY